MRLILRTVTAFLMAWLSIMINAKPATAQEQRPAHCMKFGACEVVTCNPNGTYTYTFQVTNVSAVAATQADFVLINPATAVITPNPYLLNPPLLPMQSKQITVTIGGVGPGTLCF